MCLQQLYLFINLKVFLSVSFCLSELFESFCHIDEASCKCVKLEGIIEMRKNQTFLIFL